MRGKPWGKNQATSFDYTGPISDVKTILSQAIAHKK